MTADCECLNCIFSRIQDYLDEPIPNIEQTVTELFVFQNLVQNDKLRDSDQSDIEQLLAYVDKFENDLLYDIDDARYYLDLIRLTVDAFEKQAQDASANSRFLTNRPVLSSKDRTKASALRLKNKKSVFDTFGTQHVL